MPNISTTKPVDYKAMYPPIMTPNEVAELLNCSAKYVRDMVRTGKIKGVKVGKLIHVNRDALLEQFGLI